MFSKYQEKLKLTNVFPRICRPSLLKPFTMQVGPEQLTLGEVPKISQLVVDSLVINLLELVQPNLGQTN